MKKRTQRKAEEQPMLATETEVLPPETVPTPEPAAEKPAEPWAVVLTENEIPENRGLELAGAFKKSFAEAKALIEAAMEIKISGPDDKKGMSDARSLRLQLRAVRTSGEKLKDAMKKDALRYGNAVQGFYNILKAMIEPREEKLLEMEQTAEREAAERRNAIKMAREAKLLAVGFAHLDHLNLAEMPDADFDTLLADATFMHESRERRKREEEEALAKAAEERRIAEEKAKAERAERQKSRAMALVEAGANAVATALNLGDLNQEDFDRLLETTKQQAAEREAAKAEAERLRQEREQAEREAAELKRVEDLLKKEREIIAVQFGISVPDSTNLGSIREDVFNDWLEKEKHRIKLAQEAEVEKARRAHLFESRMNECKSLGYQYIRVDFLAMDDDAYEAYKQSEIARMESEAAERAERDRLAAEAEKLRKEAAEAAAQKAAAEAAEEAARKAREAEERRAARAPDKAKIEAYLEALAAVPVPAMKTDAGQQLMDSTASLLEGVLKNIRMGLAKL